MDVLVMLEESPDHSPVLAHVNSVPSQLATERPARDIVTLYGVPSAELLALALAAAVESHRTGKGHDNLDAIRHLGVWAERGAIGDAAWRDVGTGQLVTHDLEIPLDILNNTAAQLLGECGQLIRRLVAGLSMPDWPEGARRAITVSLTPVVGLAAGGGPRGGAGDHRHHHRRHRRRGAPPHRPRAVRPAARGLGPSLPVEHARPSRRRCRWRRR